MSDIYSLHISSILLQNIFNKNDALLKYNNNEIRVLEKITSTLYNHHLQDTISTLGQNIRNKKFKLIFSKTSIKKSKKAIDAYFQDEILFDNIGGSKMTKNN